MNRQEALKRLGLSEPAPLAEVEVAWARARADLEARWNTTTEERQQLELEDDFSRIDAACEALAPGLLTQPLQPIVVDRRGTQNSQSLAAARQPGALMGHYRLLTLIGHGGMGEVWEAEDTGLTQRRVALKLVLRLDARERQALVNEARTIANLRPHPNLVTLYHVVEFGEEVALVMEYLPGESLRERLMRFPQGLDLGSVAAVMEGLLLGVAQAHAQQIIHRDLKPENIRLVKTEGPLTPLDVKVLDFGLARKRTETSSYGQEMVGTYTYSSPEQLDGKPQGTYTDVYSIGLVLYELLAGRPPWDGKDENGEISIGALYRGHTQEPVPPIRRANLPPGWWGVIHRALEKQGAARPTDAKALHSALAPLLAPWLGKEPKPMATSPSSGEAGPDPRETVADPGRFKSNATPLPNLGSKNEEPARPAKWIPWLVASGLGVGAVGVGMWFLKSRALQSTSVASLPDRAPVTEAFRNDLKLWEVKFPIAGIQIDLVQIPPGRFMMGSERGAEEARPVHEVTITRDIWMGKFPITQGQWQELMGNNPSGFSQAGTNAPVEEVSWNEVQRFLARLNNLQSKWVFRLPTEAEWEYAARAGTTTDTYVGDLNTQGDKFESKLDSIAWYAGNSGNFHPTGQDSANINKYTLPDDTKRTHPVGQKRPNKFGLFDMLGNVQQWCNDWYSDKYYKNSIKNDPQGPENGTLRIARGSNCRAPKEFVRSFIRLAFEPEFSNPAIGFRICAEISNNQEKTPKPQIANQVNSNFNTTNIQTIKQTPASIEYFKKSILFLNNKKINILLSWQYLQKAIESGNENAIIMEPVFLLLKNNIFDNFDVIKYPEIQQFKKKQNLKNFINLKEQLRNSKNYDNRNRPKYHAILISEIFINFLIKYPNEKSRSGNECENDMEKMLSELNNLGITMFNENEINLKDIGYKFSNLIE